MYDLDLHMNVSGDDEPRCIVRLTTSYWSDRRGLHAKRSLTYLRRRSRGWSAIEDEIDSAGACDAALNITNLWECKDGIYEVDVDVERRYDRTGCDDYYSFTLKPVADDTQEVQP